MTSSHPQTTGPAVVLDEGTTTVVENAHVRDSNLWVTLSDLGRATRWEIKPEGVCRDEVCITLSNDQTDALLRDGDRGPWFNLSGFARHLEQAVVQDVLHRVWSFGPPLFAWQSRPATAMAPDFTLPDFQGNLHSLSDYRGKKVFLVTWASW